MTHTAFRCAAVLAGLLLTCAGSSRAVPPVSSLALTPKPPKPHTHLPQNSPASAVAPNKLTASAALALVQAERQILAER